MTEALVGFLNINKPSGPTSHDVISQLRQITGIRRLGHTGTLDPLATGVLPICVGRATRLSEYLLGADKRYRAWIRLGESTSTFDAEGETTSSSEAFHLSKDEILVVLSEFLGQIIQTVPMYSAIKRGGTRLYELARKGIHFSPPKRTVKIHDLTLIDWQPPDLKLDIFCTSGTYIRSLAHDIGLRLGVGAHLTALMRLASGPFQLSNSVLPAALEASSDWSTYLIKPEWPFRDWPQLSLSIHEASSIRNGQKIVSKQRSIEGSLALAMFEGQLIAIVKAIDSVWKPVKVLNPILQ